MLFSVSTAPFLYEKVLYNAIFVNYGAISPIYFTSGTIAIIVHKKYISQVSYVIISDNGTHFIIHDVRGQASI